eukprot:4869379-Prymnesium_polylepis.3
MFRAQSAQQQERWQREAEKNPCAQPDNLRCRFLYSMGVRQAIWRQRLWAEPDIRIVSAGVPDYLQAVPHARFCLVSACCQISGTVRAVALRHTRFLATRSHALSCCVLCASRTSQHTEGNSWGTRLIDYMAMECVPVIVNDGMMQVFENVLPYDAFAFHLSKRQIPELYSFLHNVTNATRAA